jgi:hypothetical protein
MRQSEHQTTTDFYFRQKIPKISAARLKNQPHKKIERK